MKQNCIICKRGFNRSFPRKTCSLNCLAQLQTRIGKATGSQKLLKGYRTNINAGTVEPKYFDKAREMIKGMRKT